MTKIEMIRFGRKVDGEYLHEGKYFERVTETYKYRGEVKTRSYLKETEAWWTAQKTLEAPMFVCPCCGELVGYTALESWLGNSELDFLNDKVPCSLCYEDSMGEDL